MEDATRAARGAAASSYADRITRGPDLTADEALGPWSRGDRRSLTA